MDIRNRRALKEEASQALNAARDHKKIVSVYVGASILLSVLLMAVNTRLDSLISTTSGLSNMGNRAIWETIQTALPFLEILLVMCWDLGFLSAVLRLARRKNTDHRELLSGFSLFGPILRANLLQGLMYTGLMLGCCIVGINIFCMTPLSNEAAQILMPYIESTTALSSDIVLDEATYAALEQSLIPAVVIILILYVVVYIPVSYRLRMTSFCLLDAPRSGAWAAIRESWRMTKGNCVSLFRLDLSFWGYYLLTGLATVICYGDILLAYAGVALPISSEVAYYLFYGVYLALHFALNYWLRLKVDTTYALAYESLRPKPQSDGVVLGNIFQM